MKVIFAADHGGFELKRALKERLVKDGYEVEDMGAHTLEPSDDYPAILFPAARKIANETGTMGIFLCRSGVGAAIVANKVKGLRAAVVRSKEEVAHAREHNDIRVLALGSETLSEEQAYDIASVFLTTLFSGEERHARRIKQIDAL
ncbi:MAG TPA: RpiB/LacA/LacB family sugar-phosphate isomerase [Candidatus Paceibacterota bacterium]